MSTSSLAPRASKPDYSPISLLNTDAARLYTHIHPAIVLSIYFLSFKRIVADPVSALAALLLPLAVSQVAYVIICLPPTGSADLVGKSKSSGAGKGKKSKGRSEVTLAQKIAVRILAEGWYLGCRNTADNTK
jgi:phosphatidylinositol glycan class F